jgi:uncharacterized protein YeaO (DUF488 family)
VTVRIKRIYDEAGPDDGFRILVDRIWPRGVSKERAVLGLWLRDVAPSTELRAWFGHREERFAEFAERYRAELKQNPALDELRSLVDEHPTVTLLFGAKDARLNQAAVLADVLTQG